MGVALTLDPILRATGHVAKGKDEHDRMWDVSWSGTHITSGSTLLSSATQWFPNGKVLVQIFGAFAEHGWVLIDSPNFGGTLPTGSKVSWPLMVFRRGEAAQNLVVGVMDHAPEKLLAAGPEDTIDCLRISLTAKLKSITGAVDCRMDVHDACAWDVAWQNTHITTTGHAVQHRCFPVGSTVLAILEEIYSNGYRLVAAPSFGGDTVEWPVLVFRRSEDPKPKLLLVALRDQILAGKVCFAGEASSTSVQKLKEALEPLPGQASVELSRDRHDRNWDAVLRNTKMTTGWNTAELNYFPRNDSMMALLKTTASLGYSVVACPKFGGAFASWPSLVLEETREPSEPAFIAIKDESLPGKICVGGAKDACKGILRGLSMLTGPLIELGRDQSDMDYDECLRNTVMTTGLACFAFHNEWWPYGYMVEVILGEMFNKGWVLVGGPNFGDDKSSWPSFIFQRILET